MNNFNFSDKLVINSGRGTRIGSEIAKSFRLCGSKVTIVGSVCRFQEDTD